MKSLCVNFYLFFAFNNFRFTFCFYLLLIILFSFLVFKFSFLIVSICGLILCWRCCISYICHFLSLHSILFPSIYFFFYYFSRLKIKIIQTLTHTLKQKNHCTKKVLVFIWSFCFTSKRSQRVMTCGKIKGFWTIFYLKKKGLNNSRWHNHKCFFLVTNRWLKINADWQFKMKWFVQMFFTFDFIQFQFIKQKIQNQIRLRAKNKNHCSVFVNRFILCFFFSIEMFNWLTLFFLSFFFFFLTAIFHS